MADVPFSALYDQVLPYLPGAELGIVDSNIRKAVREWMKRTTTFREIFVVDTVAGISDYRLLPASANRQVSAIIAVYPDGEQRPIDVVPEDRRHPIAAGYPNKWFTQITDVLSFYPQPDNVYRYTVNAVTILKQDAVAMPEELIAFHGEPLAAGVLATMMGMPGKPWTQQQAGAQYGRIYSGAIRTERGKLRDGGQPNQSTFQPRVTFGV
jgi:hypothetical protein